MEFDLHCHTRHSFDCTSDVRRVVELARRRGLRGLAITDHETAAGGLEAMRYAGPDFLVIPGFEKRTRAGDILGLFMSECPTSEDPLEVVGFIQERGGIAVLPHPFHRRSTIEESLLREVDAVEGFNARYDRNGDGIGPRGGDAIAALADRYDLAVLGSSDAHDYASIGAGRTTIPGETASEIQEAIRNSLTAIAPPRARGVFGRFREWLARR